MSFIIKTILGLGVVIGGSVLLVNNVPSLQANLIRVVNPRIHQQELVQKLAENLDTLEATITETAGTPQARSTSIAKISEESQQLITKSQELIKQISDINEKHGIVDAVVGRVVDAVIKMPTPAPTPVSSPSSPATTSAPCIP